jgi:solute:Na+ symporter, SSS family
LIYTFEGGMAAVIWTDVIQTVIYIGGTLVGFVTILHHVPGGWPAIHSLADAAGKFRIFDFSLDFWKTYTFWAGLIGGAFLTTASHGTDQLIVQRLLAAKNMRQSQLALLSSGIAIVFQFAMFLMVGVLLFGYYHAFAPAAPFGSSDRIYPTFIVTAMPSGISGLLIAAILAAAMSNLSAALNSLSSSSMIDFYLRRRPATSDAKRLRLSRASTVVWAMLLLVLAIVSLRAGGRVVEVGLSIASVAYGALLGVFMLGVLTKRANERGAMLAMLCGFLLNVYIWQGKNIFDSLQLHTGLRWSVLALPRAVPWTWYVMIGSGVTFAVGYVASMFFSEREKRAQVHHA